MNTVIGSFGSAEAQSRSRYIPNTIFIDLPSGYIARNSYCFHLGERKKRIVLLLLTRGFATYEMLVDYLWGEDPCGGPNCYLHNLLFVHRYHINRKLSRIGLEIKSRWGLGLEITEI